MFVSIGEWVRLLQIVKYRIEIYNKHQSFASIFAQKHNILGSLGRGSASWKGLLQRNTSSCLFSTARGPGLHKRKHLSSAQAFKTCQNSSSQPPFKLTAIWETCVCYIVPADDGCVWSSVPIVPRRKRFLDDQL